VDRTSPTSRAGGGNRMLAAMPSRASPAPSSSDSRCMIQRSTPFDGTAMTSGVNGSTGAADNSPASGPIRVSARSARWIVSTEPTTYATYATCDTQAPHGLDPAGNNSRWFVNRALDRPRDDPDYERYRKRQVLLSVVDPHLSPRVFIGQPRSLAVSILAINGMSADYDGTPAHESTATPGHSCSFIGEITDCMTDGHAVGHDHLLDRAEQMVSTNYRGR